MDLFPIFICRSSPVMRNELIHSEELGWDLNQKRKKKLKILRFYLQSIKKSTQPVIMLTSMVPKINEWYLLLAN